MKDVVRVALINYGMFTAALTFKDGIGEIVFSGVAAEGVFAQARVDMARAMQRHGGVIGFVADVRRAALGVPQPWGGLRAHQAAAGIPGAAVSAPDNAKLCELWASTLRSQGVPRKAFTSPVQAREWVLDRAALQAQQAAWLQARSVRSA